MLIKIESIDHVKLVPENDADKALLKYFQSKYLFLYGSGVAVIQTEESILEALKQREKENN